MHPISGCESGSREADVIFIHGLCGDAAATWCHGNDESTSWPHWLGKEFPAVGVWSLGYAASPTKITRVLGWFSKRWRDAGHSMALPDRASQVLDLLMQRGIGQRPILFICHSLGGLLAKQVLRKAVDAQDLRKKQVASNTRAVLFLASPHTGVELASLANVFHTVFGTTASIEDLRAHDAHLRDLYDWYRNFAANLGIQTITYYEQRGVKGVLPIVNPSSSHPGVGADPVGLDEDHLSIAKPYNEHAQVCCAARDLLLNQVLAARPMPRTGQEKTPEKSKPPSKTIEDDIRNDSAVIDFWTDEFVGRNFVFEQAERFLADNKSGYFVVEADPGVGKTAFAAQFIKQKGFIHHFNCNATQVKTAEQFQKNICAQIISKYNLDYVTLPPDVGISGKTLADLLNRLSPMLKATQERLVIVVDALDEAVAGETGNILYLPQTMPERTYIVATKRSRAIVRLVTNPGGLETFEIKHDSLENKEDIRRYLEMKLERRKIRDYIQSHKLSPQDFVSELTGKSDGNFYYLRCVLLDIEKGIYDSAALPQGLQKYYEDHWRRMQEHGKEKWEKYVLPVIAALADAGKPISVDLISKFTGIEDEYRIQAVIEEWKQFLRPFKVPINGGTENRYTFYHWSFNEFLHDHDLVRATEARVRTHVKILRGNSDR